MDEQKELNQEEELNLEQMDFSAPEGEVCEDFHISEEPAPTVTTVNGVTMYGGVKLLMKQR